VDDEGRCHGFYVIYGFTILTISKATDHLVTLVGEGRSAGAPSMAMMGDEPICESAFLSEAIGASKVSEG
jgi:hypothetical protein